MIAAAVFLACAVTSVLCVVLLVRGWLATRSRLLYGFKHLPAWQAWTHAATTLVCEPLARTVRALLRRSWQDLRSTWRGFALVYRDLPALWRARQWR